MPECCLWVQHRLHQLLPTDNENLSDALVFQVRTFSSILLSWQMKWSGQPAVCAELRPSKTGQCFDKHMPWVNLDRIDEQNCATVSTKKPSSQLVVYPTAAQRRREQSGKWARETLSIERVPCKVFSFEVAVRFRRSWNADHGSSTKVTAGEQSALPTLLVQRNWQGIFSVVLF